MDNISIDKLQNLREVLNQIIQEIELKVPESVRPDSVQINVDLSNIIIHFELNIRGNSIIWGSRPHWPPVDAIKSWIERKNIQPYQDARGKLPTINQLAYLISRKISIHGTPAHDYYDKATEEILAQYTTQIEQAFTEDLVVLLGLDVLL